MKTIVKDIQSCPFSIDKIVGCILVAIIEDDLDVIMDDGSEITTNRVSISKAVVNELQCSKVFTGDNYETDAEKDLIVLREKLVGAVVEIEEVDYEHHKYQLIELL